MLPEGYFIKFLSQRSLGQKAGLATELYQP